MAKGRHAMHALAMLERAKGRKGGKRKSGHRRRARHSRRRK
jgi:hypothetical protein